MKEITLEFINHVKLLSLLRPIPPMYNPNEWNGSFNCYMYALNICSDFLGYRTNPGFLNKHKILIYDQYNLIKYLKEDCDKLDFKLQKTTMDEKTAENEYKIAVYLNYIGGYHFARQDSNGGWSEKIGWCGEIEVLDEEDIDKSIHGFTFVGVYKVSRKE